MQNNLMKAASTQGIPFKSRISIRQTHKPKPGPNDVLVEVYASSVNPKDWKINTLLSSLIPKLGSLSLLNIIGDDLAGIIVELGTEVKGFSLGDEVYGMDMRLRTAACANFAVINENRIALKPNNMSFSEAAAVPLAGLTALQGLRFGFLDTGSGGQINSERRTLEGHTPLKGKKVLIIGASGGVGTYAVQIAKALGAHVTGVCSSANITFIKQLGADAQVDYTVADFRKEKDSFDVVFDISAYESLISCSNLMADDGIFISTAGDAKAIYHSYRPYPFHGQKKAKAIWVDSNTLDLNILKGLIERGLLKSVIDSEYAFNDMEQAYEQSRSGRSRGKLVIKIKD